MSSPEQNPYVGARTFETHESDLFFGRDREASDLLSLVISERLVLFYAQSGAGKSSLVNAKLIPGLLEEQEFRILPTGRLRRDEIAGNVADNIYIYNLLTSLTKHSVDEDLLSKLTLCKYLKNLDFNPKDGYLYNETSHGKLFEIDGETVWKYVLIIDQFEELFTTYEEQWKKREDFFRQVAEAMEQFPHLWVVLVMREDYIAYLDPYTYLLPGRLRTRYYMQRLGQEQAIEAVRRPAEKRRRSFTKDGAKHLVNELSKIMVRRPDDTWEPQSGQYVEPVQLQVVCSSLWKKLPDNVQEITTEVVQTYVGDLNEALGNFYEDRVKAVATGKKAKEKGVSERAIRKWFEKSLIIDGKRRDMVAQEPGGKSGGLDDGVVREFVGELVREEKRSGGATFYELTHDRLVEPIIANNRSWKESHSSALQRQTALWHDQDEHENWLLMGDALTEVEQWAAEHPGELEDLDRRFLQESEKKQRERERQQELEQQQALARRRRLVTTVSIAVAVIVVGLAAFGLWQSAERAGIGAELAQAEAAYAEAVSAKAVIQSHKARAGELATISHMAFDNQLSLLLAIEALKESKLSDESRHPLATDVLQRVLVQSGKGVPLYGHTAPVNEIALSASGHWLASGGEDWTIRLWDMTAKDPGNDPMVLSGLTSPVYTLAFSPDEEWLAGAGYDGIIWLWSVKNPSAPPLFLERHSDRVNALAFSPDERWLASAGYDGALLLWDMRSVAEDPSPTFIAAPGASVDLPAVSVNLIEFSDNSEWLAIAGDDNMVSLWDMGAEDPLAAPVVVSQEDSYIYELAFGRDGRWLAIGKDSGNISLWNMEAEDPAAAATTLSGHTYTVYSLAFSPDEKWLASGSSDNTIRLWDLMADDPTADPLELSGHSGSVITLTFSQDGHWLASGSDDTTLRLWNMEAEDPALDSVILKGHTSSINGLVFSPDGEWLASSSYDSTVRLLEIEALVETEADIRGYELVQELHGHRDAIKRLLFSPDGLWLASVDEADAAQMWKFQAGAPNEASATLAASVRSLVFDPYGTLYGGGDQGTIYSWNPSSAALFSKASLRGFKSTVSELASWWNPCYFSGCPSPTDSLLNNTDFALISLGNNNSLQLWQGLGSWEYSEPHTFSGVQQVVNTVLISPNGQWLASGGASDPLVVWNLSNESLKDVKPAILREEGEVFALAFDPNSRWLASAGANGSIRLWDFSDPDELPRRPYVTFNSHSGPVRALTFSPRGRWLASAGEDGRILLWDMQAKNPADAPILIGQQAGSITTLVFSPDGRWLASGGDDQKIRLWGANLDDLQSQACLVARRNLTWQEWKDYFGNEPYHKTCAEFPVHISVAEHFFEPGDSLARTGEIDAAVASYADALKDHPEIGESIPDLKARASEKAAQALMEAGDELAQDGNIDEAVSKYVAASELDPTLKTKIGKPQEYANGLRLETLKADFYQLMYTTQAEKALENFTVLQSVDRNILEALAAEDSGTPYYLCANGNILNHAGQVAEACEKAVELYPEDGYAHDLRGINRSLLRDFRGAIEDFKISADWFNDFGDDAASRKRMLWIGSLERGKNPIDDATLKLMHLSNLIVRHVDNGNHEDAIAEFVQGQAIYPDLLDFLPDPHYMNEVCWDGSILGHAADVEAACEMAVRRSPEDPYYIDSRGLNQALLGNYQGAIADFEFAIEGFRQNGQEDYAMEREDWVEALKIGHIPFDEETLEYLLIYE